MEHTKEPWSVGQYREIIDADGLGVVVAGFHLSTGRRDSSADANTRRIVACVNKFAGMSTEEIEALPADVPMILKRLSERSLQVDQLQEVCAEAYQFAGAYDAPVEVLDNLHAAANGLPLPHESFLPVDDSELVKQRDQLLAAVEYAERMLTNMQPHIVQACDPERVAFIDNYVDPVIDNLRAAIAAVKGE